SSVVSRIIRPPPCRTRFPYTTLFRSDGIVVSNHGGRQLDGVLSTTRALPPIADAVKGELKILVDSGIRNGLDVVRMLAMGADTRSEEHTSELQSRENLVCRLLLEKKN